MSIFSAVIQGIVQGLTEFLPVSSSGHLLISQHILGVHEDNLFFNVMLHIGTLLAVLFVYYKSIFKLIKAFFEMISDVFKKRFNIKDLNHEKNMVLMLIIGLIPLFLLFIPVPGSGMNIKDLAPELASEKNLLLVGMALMVTSFMLKIGINKRKSYKVNVAFDSDGNLWDGKKDLNVMDALWVGFTQFVAAVFPGISRSGSTLSTGLLREINKETALDYSFILGVPAIIAAAAVELKDALKSGALSNIDVIPVVVGMIVSAVVGFLSIKLFKWLLKTDKMMIFVVYTFVVGILSVIIAIIENIYGFNLFTGRPI
ncbi:MAG: undecaprenyl-diphosphate phosphatase [Clostridia bacterium]|nr:undecaprenyl-diphosphate phosphatase [Clostridia bacterium]